MDTAAKVETSTGGTSLPDIPEALESASVRAGWLMVDAYERLGLTRSKQTFGPELDAWHEYAKSTVGNLREWPGSTHAITAVYQTDNNRLRFRRTLDFVQRGDRIFDIGLGRGYLCGVLVRDGGIASYRGIDIIADNVAATKKMADTNELRETPIDVGMGNLFDLTADQLLGSSLVICCEVLEHLEAPEHALQILASALPHDADLLITVPMYGRLDAVWDHRSIFDAKRLRAAIDAAGLHVHHVEPLANAWTLALLSHRRSTSVRAQQATTKRPRADTAQLANHNDFIAVDTSRTRCVGGKAQPSQSESAASCRVPTSGPLRSLWGANGGLAFDVDNAYGLRLELGLENSRNVKRVSVKMFSGNDVACEWVWSPIAQRLKQEKKTFVLYPGKSGAFFKAVQGRSSRGADRVEIRIMTRPRSAATLTLHRAAYLGHRNHSADAKQP